jgi:hypothetical protein
LDEFILKNDLKWIPYNKLKNIEYFDKGEFGTLYKAIWIKKVRNQKVVLKCHNILNENLDEFLNKV